MLLLAIPFGLAIGLIVGAVGGGGAILALPVLVYVLGEGVGPASTAALIVVALAAAVGAGARARDGQMCWRLALLFSTPGGAGVGRGCAAERRGEPARADPRVRADHGRGGARDLAARRARGGVTVDSGCPPAQPLVVVGAGFAVGALTGFFGVGGGFMIVPVLALGLALTFRRAVATSLVIITLTGAAALASHLVAGAKPDLGVTATLAAPTMVGALARDRGRRAAAAGGAGRGFAVIVALVALFLLVDAILLGGPPMPRTACSRRR